MKPSWITGIIISACCLAALGIAGMSIHAGQGGDTQGNPHDMTALPDKDSSGLPPAEAVTACVNKSTGDACEFSDRGTTRSGTCDKKPGVLACAPDRGQNTGPSTQDTPGTLSARTVRKTIPPGTTPAVAVSGSGAGLSEFTLTSEAGPDGSVMSDIYTCDGAGLTPALAWAGAPAGTKEYALMMTTIPVDGSTRWNWVLYGIPGNITSLVQNSTGLGIPGTGSHGTVMQYDPPCSQGPGAKVYTFTLYALSDSPSLPLNPASVTGEVLTNAIRPVTLGSASISMSHSRKG